MYELRRTAEFLSWFRGLRDRIGAQRIVVRLERMAQGNLGDIKPVGEGVSEARIKSGPGYRLYFVRREEVVIVLLCGGDKSSQDRDIARAKAMAREIEP
jgi:putative addiction module killer protein